MKTYRNYWFIAVVVLMFAVIYQTNKKENIYIYIEDLKGYCLEYSNPNDLLKTTKIQIRQSGKLSYQFWEIIIDTMNCKKINIESLQNKIINSQYFIINNCGGIGTKDHLLKKYKLNIIVYKNNEYYNLPVKSIGYGMY